MISGFLTTLQFIDPLLPLLLTLMIHSTVVLGVALLLSFAMRLRGILAQAFVLRMFLVATLAAPVIVMFGPLPAHLTVKIPHETAQKSPCEWQFILDNGFAETIGQTPVDRLKAANTDMSSPAERNEMPMLSRESAYSLPGQHVRMPSDLSPEKPGLSDIAVLMLLRGFAALWIVLCCMALWCIIAAHVFLFRMRWSAEPAPDNMIELCRHAARKVGVRCPVLAISSQITSPILSGWIRPVILLPSEWDETPGMLEQVLLHELYHLAQRDTFWNLIRELGTSLYPLQPLMRILSRRLETLSDYACDAFVVERLPNGGTYIDNLLILAGRHLKEKYGISLHAGFFKHASLLRRRIRRLLTGQEGELLPITCTRMAAITAVCAGTIIATVSLAVEYERSDMSFSLQNVVEQATDSVVVAGRHYTEQIVETANSDSEAPDQTVAEKQKSLHDRPQAGIDTEATQHTPVLSMKPAKPMIMSQNNKLDRQAQSAAVNGQETSNDYNMRITGNEVDSNNSKSVHHSENNDFRNHVSSDSTVSPFDTLASQQPDKPQFMMGLSMAGAPFEVKLPAAKEINVVMEYDFDKENLQLDNDEDRYLYSIYFGLEKRKNEPAWSPDGTEIAFTDNNRIWVVPADGGEPRMVYENLCKGYSIGGVESICYTPDGSGITFKRFVYDESRGSMIQIKDKSYVSFNNPASDIESVNLATGESRVLVENGYSCDWSPGGSMIVYLGSPDGAQFNPGIDTRIVPMVFDMASGERRALTEPGVLRYGAPAFNHDGTAIYVTAREKNGPVNLYSIPVTGGDPLCLTEYNADDGYGKYRNYPECSPDGRWILYTDQTPTKTEPNQRLFLYEISTGEVTPFFTEPEYSRSYGTWSPTGDRICYVESRDGKNYLYLASFDRYNTEKAASSKEEPQYPFSLSQNYPNPFNSATTIEFSIPEDSMVDLCIYNILGQQVRSLVSEKLAAGNHIVRWDGRSESGNNVGSGVYVSVLTAGGKRNIQRMTCLR